MRVECQSCRELVVATFTIVDGAITSTCSACHATMRPVDLPSTPDTAKTIVHSSSMKPSLRQPRCPKCGVPRTAAAACPSCGLASDRMEAFTGTVDAAVPEVVRAAWQRVIEGWTEPARHDALFGLVTQYSAFAWAAGRYRDAEREHPDDSIADKQLTRMRRAMEATLLVTATQRPDATTKPYQSTLAILIVLVLLMAIGVIYAMIRDNTPPAKPPVGQPLRP